MENTELEQKRKLYPCLMKELESGVVLNGLDLIYEAGKRLPCTLAPVSMEIQ